MSETNKSKLKIRRLVLGMVQTNCYLLCNEENSNVIVVDPGDRADAIKNEIEKNGLTLAGILLTHGHFDHILAVKELANHYSVKIYASEMERELLANVDMNCSKQFGHLVECEADEWLRDNEEITLSGFKIRVIATPGHTSGSVCYLLVEHGILITGDTLFLESVGRCDLPTGNEQTILKSIREKLFVLDEQIIVLPGHGDRTTIGYEKRNNPYFSEEAFWE